jgi:hypothetical protein
MFVAFHNDKNIKNKYYNRVLAHQKADEIIQGIGWENGRGCAVGCTLESYDHKQYEVELGIPEWLARLEDILFEGMIKKDALVWPAKFLKAINVGADLNKIKTSFIIFILKENLKTLDSLKFDKKFDKVIKAIDLTKAATKQMIKAQNSRDLEKISEAERAAESAAESAWSVAESAARSAARSAWSAAESAAWSAWSAAQSAQSAAQSAAWSAQSAQSAAWSAAESARSAAYKKYAEKLLELIRCCK